MISKLRGLSQLLQLMILPYAAHLSRDDLTKKQTPGIAAFENIGHVPLNVIIVGDGLALSTSLAVFRIRCHIICMHLVHSPMREAS